MPVDDIPWVGLPCVVCDVECRDALDFWETPDDGLMNAIHLRCQEWVCDLPTLRRLLAAK